MRDLPGQLLRGHAMQNSEKDIWISMGVWIHNQVFGLYNFKIWRKIIQEKLQLRETWLIGMYFWNQWKFAVSMRVYCNLEFWTLDFLTRHSRSLNFWILKLFSFVFYSRQNDKENLCRTVSRKHQNPTFSNPHCEKCFEGQL